VKVAKRKPDLNVNGTIVRVIAINGTDFLCISDIALLKNPVEPKDVVKNWMRTRSTISFLGLWEKLNNPDFKGVEFDPLLKVAVLRAGTSIGANVHEGAAAQTKADFIAKCSISLKECNETAYWLELLYKMEYLKSKEYESISKDCSEIFAILTSIIKTARSRL